MIECDKVEERRDALARLRGIEYKVWIRVADHDKMWAIADEDLQREDETKTSSVYFLRFELTPAMVAATKRGADVSAGSDHADYSYSTRLAPEARDSLAKDLV